MSTARLTAVVSTKGVEKANKELKTLANTSKVAERRIGGVGRGAGQAGIQVQQFVGQIQGGQSAMLALSQQSADLGFVLGAPLLGAVVGISASLVGILIPALSDSSGQVEEFTLDIEEATKGLNAMTKAQVAVGISEITESMTDLHNEAEVSSDKIRAMNETLEQGRLVGGGRGVAVQRIQLTAKETENLTLKLNKEQATLDLVNKKFKEQEQVLIKLAKIQGGSTKSEKELEEEKAKEEEIKQLLETRLELRKKLAQRELQVILGLNNTELENINAKETAILTKLKSDYENKLILHTEYLRAKEEAEISADKQRKKLLDSEIKAEEVRAKQKDAIKQQEVSDNKTALNDLTNNLETSLGRENKLFKASAIANATIKTYESATSAFSAMASIPYVGPILGGIAAAGAITAGLANVQAIRSTREQGGHLNAGQSSTVAERGQLEVLTPSSSSRIRTKQQMQELMGGNSGGGDVNITVIDQSTGNKSFEESKTDDGRIILLIRDTVSSDASNPNSQIRKSFGSSTNLQARR